ncbi:unnamed protein product, partial [Rotaria sp. Silwood2]
MPHGNAAKRFLDAGEEPTKTLTPLKGYEKKDLTSLEESVKSIEVPIHDRDAMVWAAKRNSHNPSDGLSSDESASICLYTMEWPDGYDSFYTLLNKKLRSGERKCLKSWFSYLKLFLTALYKLPSIKKIIWRGIRGNVSDQYNKDYIWWGVSSCTTTVDGVENFIGCTGERTLFMIECFNGKAIKSHSAYQDENEILLIPGTYLTVLEKWSSSDNLHIIHLKEENPPYQLLKSPFVASLAIVDVSSSKKPESSKLTRPKSQAAPVPFHEIKKVSTNMERTIRRTVEHGIQKVNDMEKDEALALMCEQCDHEKQELIELDYLFSSYHDRVKYFEQTNKQLKHTLNQLRSKYSFDSDKYKSEYKPKLNNLRKTTHLATVEEAIVEIRVKRAEFDLIYYKKLVDDLNQWTNQDKLKINSLQSTIDENQREFKHVQHLIAVSMSDIEKYHNEMKRFYEQISNLLNELDQERMARIKIENEKQTFKEQISFLSAIHEQEMNDLKNVSSSNFDINSITFYKNELPRAIREIRKDFEIRSLSQRLELEEYYKIKTDEIIQQEQQQENNQLINQDDDNQLKISINETEKELLDLQQDYKNYFQQMSELESKLETVKR